MLGLQARISRRRVGLFGRIPDDTDVWWGQIQAAAAADGLDPGSLADWLNPDNGASPPSPVGASVPRPPNPPYREPQGPAAERAAALARAARKPPPQGEAP